MAKLPEPFMAGGVGKPWSVVRRLQFIEFRLYWEGTLNRADLTEKFGVSPAQTTIDISDYQRIAPGNCKYDTKAKTYVAGRPFKPIFDGCTSPRYLNELRSLGEKVILRYDAWLGAVPASETLPRVQSRVHPEVLQSLIRVINEKRALLIYYQSSSRPIPENRWITPHALFDDGSRWHARAFCHHQRGFRDFQLGRIVKSSISKDHNVPVECDREWSGTVDLVFQFHPKLPEARRAAVALDYRMTDGRLAISIRAALSPHLIRVLRADLDPKTVGSDQSPIVIKDRSHLESRLNALRAESEGLVADLDVFKHSR